MSSMKTEYEVIALVQCTNHRDWVDIQNVFYRNCVLTNTNENVRILCYYPDTGLKRGEFQEKGNFLYYGIDEDLEWSLGRDPRNERFIEALGYVLEHYQFDMFYRGGGTSYIVYDKMYDFLHRIKSDKLYCGAVNSGYVLEDKIVQYYVSGFNLIMSRDSCEELYNNKHIYLSYNIPEDTAIGVTLVDELNYIKPEDQPKECVFHWLHNYCDGKESDDFLRHMNKTQPIFNYKIKPSTSECMQRVHEVLYV